MLATLLLLSLSSYDFTDAFTYADGADGAPQWYVETVAWEVADGAMLASGDSRTFAVLEAAPYATRMELEADVTIRERTAAETGWGVAGIAVRWDAGNFWHLALCEAPDGQNRRHFVELQESLDGAWLATTAEGSRLTQTAHEGNDFNWRYGETYRLRLVLTSEGINGDVFDGIGARRAHIGWRFDNKAVTAGRPALDAGGFRVAFDNVRVAIIDETPGPEPVKVERPPYNVAASDLALAPATGFFGVAEVDGRAWFVDPNGRAFYAIGTDHIRYGGHWCEKLGYAPYGRNMEEKYGSEEAWAETTAQRLKDWGFNAVTAGHSESMRYRDFAHTEFLSFGSSFAGMDDLCPKVHWTGFPNVFSPKWPRHCERMARQQCAPHADDPWLLGYFLDNELEWYGKNYRDHGLFDEAWKKPADHTAKQAWLAFLNEKGVAPDDVKTLWGVDVASIDALADHVEPQPPLTPRAEEIARDWVRLVAEKYFGECARAIRKYDPNHLILGSRFAGRAPDIWDIAGKHCDVVSFNMYPRIDVDRGMPQSVIDQIVAWHEQAGRPLMITEWSFPALDTALPSMHGAGMRVDTQEQRTRCFEYFQRAMFSLPFMVGSDFFMFVDEPALGISSTFPEDSNYGLVNEQDEPYELLTQAAARLHPQVYKLHTAGSVETMAPLPPLGKWYSDVPDAVPFPPGAVAAASGEFTVACEPGVPAVRLKRGDVLLGSLTAVMHQIINGQDFWNRASSTALTAFRFNDDKRVLDVTFTSESWTAEWRFHVPNSGEWIASQCLSVTNTGDATWELGEAFHYLLPEIAGVAADDVPLANDVPNYYRSGGAWVDEAAGIGLACWFRDGDVFECRFWKNEQGGFHADLRQKADVVLAPGEMWTPESNEPAFIFPISPPTREGFGKAIAEMSADIAKR